MSPLMTSASAHQTKFYCKWSSWAWQGYFTLLNAVGPLYIFSCILPRVQSTKSECLDNKQMCQRCSNRAREGKCKLGRVHTDEVLCSKYEYSVYCCHKVSWNKWSELALDSMNLIVKAKSFLFLTTCTQSAISQWLLRLAQWRLTLFEQ